MLHQRLFSSVQPPTKCETLHADAFACSDLLIRRVPAQVHLKGFIVGNPYTDPVENMKGMFGAYWGHQMVPAPMYKSWIENCGDSESIDTYYDDTYCTTLEDDMFDIIGDVDW